MLHVQGQAHNPAALSPSLQQNRQGEKDSNFNFLPGKGDKGVVAGGGRGGGGRGGADENRNKVRPRNLSPLGRDQPSPMGPTPGLLSPLSRLPCWTPLEPLPEVENSGDGYGRVPPEGAEEGKTEPESPSGEAAKQAMRAMVSTNRNSEKDQAAGRKGGAQPQGGEADEEEEEDEEARQDGDEWGDSDSEFGFSTRSGSPLNAESGGEGSLTGAWDRVGVGEPRDLRQHPRPATGSRPAGGDDGGVKEPSGWSVAGPGDCLTGEGPNQEAQSTDSDGELPDLMDSVWTLRDREHFKAQEMEKHQVQLTMYRRLALIRWVRALQGHVQEQQDRLQSSFDVILTHRKELLRMGASISAVAPPTAAVGQS